MAHNDTTKGRCVQCNVAWVWTGRRRLKETPCPRCGRQLRPTTHLLKSAPWLTLSGEPTELR